jgi:hypothetical protein
MTRATAGWARAEFISGRVPTSVDRDPRAVFGLGAARRSGLSLLDRAVRDPRAKPLAQLKAHSPFNKRPGEKPVRLTR